MKRTRAAFILLAFWLVALGALGFYVYRELNVGADLRLFMPSPVTPAQRLLLDQIGEGPAARVLVIAIDGAAPAELADISRELAAKIAESKEFRLVANGDESLDAIPDDLLAYRYLLTNTFDSHPLDAPYLHQALQARARDLASPAASFLEPILPRDPTLEILNLLQGWQPMQEPNRQYDVWFDRDGKRALLIAETVAPAFDPDKQEVALAELQRIFDDVRGKRPLHYYASGPGVFGVAIRDRTQNEAQWLGTFDTIGVAILVLVAYRRFASLFLSLLPIVSAGIVGLFSVSALFGAVHGITLAFGFTLIGIAQDYPMHLLSHEHKGRSSLEIVRELWPTLATGVASTCIAYLAFFFSGVNGLAQLACFAICGLATAGLTTRFLLPRLLDPSGRDHGDSIAMARTWRQMDRLPRPWIGAAVLAVAAVVAILTIRTPMWENDLGKLTPVPPDLLARDIELRSQLGTPDLRYMWVIEAANDDAALTRLESLEPKLKALIGSHAIAGFDDAARYVPSHARQLARQERLPDREQLKAELATATKDTPFREGVFEPFLGDVERARTLPTLTVEKIRETPLGASVDILMLEREGKTTALVTFVDVQHPEALATAARDAGPDVLLLDLKDASESLVAHQRERILWSLAIASVLLVAVIAFTLRRPGRVARVLAPMALTTLLVLGVLRVSGVSLNLFHLIALILAAGLGLDYALFFEHASHDEREQRRTLHAVLVCSLSTLMTFALLGLSTTPVLRAIGVTVSLGVIFNFVLALLLTRPAKSHAAS